ncbi:DUF1810 domain-containing protein [Novosphingobium olei]|uniref:DUF1810 domain-containing protein n=1 Tax=Novosphingobium olei TaxID=2728851 RepID=A0A7Y0BSW8_9SPHN|nr:DUF1810 domain-containing protein [Novosphingobium olei]NML95939.1 DUF1810 domain-containing protein [Novosphingobium olei]
MNYNLERFVDAQRDTYQAALREIRSGRKQTHWIWYIFPQMSGLGRSGMAQRFAIRSLEEAQAYLAHPVLGSRLQECVTALQDLPMSGPEEVFGALDAVKVRSSLTLFAEADPEQALFSAALDRWYKGARDPRTLNILVPATTIDRADNGARADARPE